MKLLILWISGRTGLEEVLNLRNAPYFGNPTNMRWHAFLVDAGTLTFLCKAEWEDRMAVRTCILADVHSPGMTRAIQPLKNIDALYEAFNVKEGGGIYLARVKRVKFW